MRVRMHVSASTSSNQSCEGSLKPTEVPQTELPEAPYA